MKKTNKLISILLVVAMLLSMAPMTVFATDNLTDTTTSVTLKDADGDGLYEIGTAADLYAFANLVNAGNTSISVELTTDITLNENVLKEDGTLNGDGSNFTPWVPIGGAENKFAGVFDGKKHTISGLYYNGTDTYVGLFGSVDGKYQSDTIGVIKNIAIVDSYLKTTISGYNIWVRVGGVAGFANSHSHFQNCFVQATIEVDNSSDCKLCIGGIAGMTYANAVNCCTDVAINYNDEAMSKSIGGILALVTNGSIVNCHTSWSVVGEYNSGTKVTDCSTNVTNEQFASGEITYLLNGSKVEPSSVWKQTLGEDNYPSFNGGYVAYDETKGYYNTHFHSFCFSSSGDTITAVCENTDGNCPDTNGGTLTISAPADLYADGTTAKEATVENNLVDTSVTIGDITYSTADGSAPKTAGTYTASVTVGGATASVQFTLLNYAAKVTDKDGNELSGSPYKTFAEAITAASASEDSTLTLLDDITLTETARISSGKFILDLNGKTILNKTDNVLLVYYHANITIKDSCEGGTVETGGDYCYGISNLAELTVESGTIKGNGSGISNHGTLTVNGGNFEAYTYGAITNKATAKIYGGVFEGIDRGEGIQNDASGEIYIYGGKISGNTALLNTGTAYISGGEFTGNDYAALNILKGTVEVTGGSFTGTDFSDGYFSGTPYGEWTVDFDSGATFALKGGEFPNGFVTDETTANAFLAEGYHFRDADGKIIEVPEDARVINGYAKVSKGADLSDAVITFDQTKFTYSGNEHKPTVTVKVGGKALTDGKDYTVSYANNINAGTATVTITAVADSDYSGKATADFTIAKKPVTVTATAPDKVYDGTSDIDYDEIVITFDGIVDGDTVGYTIKEAWYNGINAGENKFVPVVFNVTGGDADNYSFPEGGEYIAPDYFVETTADITAKDISDGFIILGEALTYNGKEQTQTVEKVLATGTAPEVTYTVSGNKATNVGVYLLTVTGTGNFTGEAKIAYEIAPDTTGIDAVTVENVTSANKADIEAVKAQIDNAVTDIADDETKAEYKAIADKCDELLAVINDTADEIERVENAAKAFDEDTVKSTDREAIEQLKDDIQALIDSSNVTEEEIASLEEKLEEAEALTDKIAETEEQLEEIAGIENEYNPETVTSDDKAAIEDAIAAIEAVNPDNLTDEQKAEYDEIKAGFEALLEEIAAAEKNVADIGIEFEMLDEERVTKFWEDDIEALKAKIDELLADENMGEAEKTKLNEYKAQCDKLIEIINDPVEYFSLRFFYLIWDCLTWKWNGLNKLFESLFGIKAIA